MFKSNGGFTLVELVVVIAILAILAGIAVPAYSGYIEKANAAADSVALSAVKTAVMAFAAGIETVTEINVTETQVSYNGGGPIESVPDFKLYYGLAEGESFSLELKTGNTATWTAQSGKWTISE